jgi:hypothetical protein
MEIAMTTLSNKQAEAAAKYNDATANGITLHRLGSRH